MSTRLPVDLCSTGVGLRPDVVSVVSSGSGDKLFRGDKEARQDSSNWNKSKLSNFTGSRSLNEGGEIFESDDE